MENLYSQHYDKIAVLREDFEKTLNILQQTKDLDKKLKIATLALQSAVYTNTAYFTSSVLETFFVDIAKTLDINLNGIKYKPNTFLHVLSEGYTIGGHTRVVERWIKNAPNPQVHDVVLTRPNDSKLILLEKNVAEKNGNCIYFDNTLTLIEKSIKLRKLGMNYEYIILHIHMDDPVATIAFGVNEFTRPILFYNHASHLFWLGKSIADLVLDIKKDDEVTKIKRGISNTFFLGVPSKEIAITQESKKEARKRLGLPLDKKIIVTSGGAYKYQTICGNRFYDYIEKIIDENTYCYAIGIGERNPEWKKAKQRTKNHIIPMNPISFNDGYLDYLKAADLYLDSYPLCGGTATIDAISSGIPVLSLKSVYPQFDYLIETSSYCKTKEEFIYKAKKILNDKEVADKFFREVKTSLIKYQSIESWNNKITKLFEITPKTHKIQNLSNTIDYKEISDLSVVCNALTNKIFIKIKNIKIFKMYLMIIKYLLKLKISKYSKCVRFLKSINNFI